MRSIVALIAAVTLALLPASLTARPVVHGTVHVQEFVDFNGNLQFDPGDLGEQCTIYVFSYMGPDYRVPDDVASPDDPRLPFFVKGGTDSEGRISFPLPPGEFAVLRWGCSIPTGYGPFTAFEVRNVPEVSRVSNVSGTSSWEIQRFEIQADVETQVITARQPLGEPVSPPPDAALTPPSPPGDVFPPSPPGATGPRVETPSTGTRLPATGTGALASASDGLPLVVAVLLVATGAGLIAAGVAIWRRPA